MESRQSKHAHHVVKSFKNLIPEAALAQLREEHFEELALLIEAAIDATLVEQLNSASVIAEQAAKAIKALQQSA